MTEQQRHRLAFLLRAFMPYNIMVGPDRELIEQAISELRSGADADTTARTVEIDGPVLPVGVGTALDIAAWLAAYRDGELLLSRATHAQVSAETERFLANLGIARLWYRAGNRVAWILHDGTKLPPVA